MSVAEVRISVKPGDGVTWVYFYGGDVESLRAERTITVETAGLNIEGPAAAVIVWAEAIATAVREAAPPAGVAPTEAAEQAS